MMSGVIDALVAKRKELGLSQAALAERTGMKQSAVARIESKRISPTLETIETLCEAMGLVLFVRRWAGICFKKGRAEFHNPVCLRVPAEEAFKAEAPMP